MMVHRLRKGSCPKSQHNIGTRKCPVWRHGEMKFNMRDQYYKENPKNMRDPFWSVVRWTKIVRGYCNPLKGLIPKSWNFEVFLRGNLDALSGALSFCYFWKAKESNSVMAYLTNAWPCTATLHDENGEQNGRWKHPAVATLNKCISLNSLWWHVATCCHSLLEILALDTLLTSPRTAEPMLMADDAHPEPHQWGMWVFPKIGVPQNGWFIMENPIKMDDLGIWGYHYFWKHPCSR